MMRSEILTESPQATRALGRAIGRQFSGGEVVLLHGPLGAGKTTLVQGIAEGLGITTRIQSPSFVLERLHRGRLTLRHLDFYRLGPEDVEESGFFADADERAVTVIEWAERVGRVPDATLGVKIDMVPASADCRLISVEPLCREWGDKIRDVIEEQAAGR